MTDAVLAPGAASDRGALDRAVHKNLIRIVPLLAVAYFFNYIDRTNVGFAALTMNRDLGLTNAEFGAAAGASSRACPGASESTLRWRGPVLVRNGAGLACRNDRR